MPPCTTRTIHPRSDIKSRPCSECRCFPHRTCVPLLRTSALPSMESQITFIRRAVRQRWYSWPFSLLPLCKTTNGPAGKAPDSSSGRDALELSYETLQGALEAEAMNRKKSNGYFVRRLFGIRPFSRLKMLRQVHHCNRSIQFTYHDRRPHARAHVVH